MGPHQFTKPKILCIDLPRKVQSELITNGFAAEAGTFGRPYTTSPNGYYEVVHMNWLLPNLGEQDVIFINIGPVFMSNLDRTPNAYRPSASNVTSYLVKHTTDRVDPRPPVMNMWSSQIDRMIAHGGLVVVFSAPPLGQEFALGTPYNGHVEESLDIDLWSFASCLHDDRIRVSVDPGTELTVNCTDSRYVPFLSKHCKSFFFNIVFSVRDPELKWLPLLQTKFAECASVVISANDHPGNVVVLPQCHELTFPKVILDFLTMVGPEISPHLFPYHVGARWLQQHPYDHLEVRDIARRRADLVAEAEAACKELDAEIQQVRTKKSHLHGILTKKGGELVHDIRVVLEQLGFDRVVDGDTQQPNANQLQEDLQIHDDLGMIVVEAKGLSGLPREDDSTQVHKYIIRRMKDLKRTDIRGAFIVNHQAHIPALSRDHQNVFTPQQIADAEANGVVLVTTWDLFILVRGIEQCHWSEDVIKPRFYESGRFQCWPNTYERIGIVANFFSDKRIVSIQLDPSSTLRVGERLGFRLEYGFYEFEVRSMQKERVGIDSASGGDKVGVAISPTDSKINKDVVVYRAGSPRAR